MVAIYLTDKFAKAVVAHPTRGQQIHYDIEQSGFGLRITKSGHKSFILNYHTNGRERRITIGHYPTWSVAAAREEAKRLKREADIGGDPLNDRKKRKAAATLRELWERYKSDILGRKSARGQNDEASIWDKLILPALGNRVIDDIRPAEIDRLHRSISLNTPVRANRTIASLRHALNLGKRWEMCTSNPAQGVLLNREQPRARYLSSEEVGNLLRVLDDREQSSSTDLIRWLLFTGCRLGEALSASWDQIDLKAGIWTKASSHTKQKRVHRVPLSSTALAILNKTSRSKDNAYIFRGLRRGQPITTIKRTWHTVRSAAGLHDVRLHDLRHTYASWLASDGQSLPVIGHLLGHTQPATTNRYAHLLDAPLRAATENVGAKLRSQR